MFTKIPERFRTRVALKPQATGSAGKGFLAPTPGVMGITLRCIVAMGAAAALTLSLKTAADATDSGSAAAAYPVNVPIYVNGVRIADAKAYEVPATDNGKNVIVDFCIDPATVPEAAANAFVGISYAQSSASNILSVEMIEDVAYKPTAS
jgi:hypothetical protein